MYLFYFVCQDVAHIIQFSPFPNRCGLYLCSLPCWPVDGADRYEASLNDSCSAAFHSYQNVPPDLSVCAFVMAQCLSVRALQEMLAHSEHLAAEVRVFSSPLFIYLLLFSLLFYSPNASQHKILLAISQCYSYYNLRYEFHLISTSN